MAKKKKAGEFPYTIYIVRVIDGEDSYYNAFTSIPESEDAGELVGVYELQTTGKLVKTAEIV